MSEGKLFREEKAVMLKLAHAFLRNKYSHFFVSILLLFLLNPLFDKEGFPFLSFLVLLIMLTVLWSLKLRKRLFITCLIMAAVAFVFNFLFLNSVIGGDKNLSLSWGFITILISALFLVLVISILFKRIFAEKNVTVDTIQGGASLYILMGILWAFVYQIAVFISPHSLVMKSGPLNFAEIMYFSFVTLATLGYGDITPANYFLPCLLHVSLVFSLFLHTKNRHWRVFHFLKPLLRK